MINWHDKKRLAEQLKFFGAKKQRFISCYAKKPRIRVGVGNLYKVKCGAEALRRLHQDHLAIGVDRTAFGFNQMAQAQCTAGGLMSIGQQHLQQIGLSSPSNGMINSGASIGVAIMGGLI